MKFIIDLNIPIKHTHTHTKLTKLTKIKKIKKINSTQKIIYLE